MNLINSTDFVAERYVVQDATGRDLLLVVSKATYEIGSGSYLSVAEEQEPILEADDYYDEPETSGIRNSADVAWGISSTGVALIGDAVAPDDKTSEMLVSLSVGELKHNVCVFGGRKWKRTLMGWKPGTPEVFDRIPLRYEFAYGGEDCTADDEKVHLYERRNPLGVGAWSKKGTVKPADLRVPQIENPDELIRRPSDQPVPVGFGFVSSYWEPRIGFAGTCDETWQQERMPLLPEDFDVRFNQSANPDLIYDGFLQGNEDVLISGASKGGRYAFRLPDMKLEAVVGVGGDFQRSNMNLSKLVIDAEEQKLLLTWTCEFDVHGRLYEVGDIALREVEATESKGIRSLLNV